MKKRIADWLEKVSAGAALLGLFQGRPGALLTAAICLILSIYISRRLAP